MNSSEADQQTIIDGEHLRLLAIFHFVAGGLAFLGVALSLFYLAMFQTFFSNPDLWAQSQQGPPPAQIMGLIRWLIVVFAVWFLVSSVGNLLSGLFMRARRCRGFSMFMAVINCLHLPIGTVLGVFTLIVLSRESVQRSYDQSQRATRL